MSSQSDDLPIIYGTEFQARALCAQTSSLIDQQPVRFMVGTLSLKNENKIHLLEFHDDLSSNKVGLYKLVFKHDKGEVWDISCSPKQPNLFTTCYSTNNPQDINKKCSLWKFPMDLSNCFIDEDEMTNTQLIHQYDLNKNTDTMKNGFHNKISLWHPEDGDKICTMELQSLVLWDVDSGKEESELKVNFDNLNLITRENKINKFRWSPHSHCSILGLAINNQILGKDLRSDKDYVWRIEDLNSQVIKNLDFNPNAQYYLASCGEDCQFKLWDIRKPTEPIVSMSNHSHWIWSVRYNLYHDQLILTCSSDCKVILSRVNSFASQPFGHLLDTEDTLNETQLDEDTAELSINDTNKECTDNLTESTNVSQKKLEDGVVSVYLEHEDSVYAAEWSNADPWIFASLSYDGRIALNRGMALISKFRKSIVEIITGESKKTAVF